MRHSYGIMDERKILTYKPQLFRKTDELLVFPWRDFNKWYSDIKEYIDGLYQINSKEIQHKGKSIGISDLNLAIGILSNITNELENLFDPLKVTDFTYHYISTLDDKYKKRRGYWYGRYMQKIDGKVITITPELKYRNMMEIVRHAEREFDRTLKEGRNLQIKSRINE